MLRYWSWRLVHQRHQPRLLFPELRATIVQNDHQSPQRRGMLFRDLQPLSQVVLEGRYTGGLRWQNKTIPTGLFQERSLCRQIARFPQKTVGFTNLVQMGQQFIAGQDIGSQLSEDTRETTLASNKTGGSFGQDWGPVGEALFSTSGGRGW